MIHFEPFFFFFFVQIFFIILIIFQQKQKTHKTQKPMQDTLTHSILTSHGY